MSKPLDAGLLRGLRGITQVDSRWRIIPFVKSMMLELRSCRTWELSFEFSLKWVSSQLLATVSYCQLTKNDLTNL